MLVGEHEEFTISYEIDDPAQRVSVVACAVSDPFTARATDGEVLKRRWFEVSEVLRLMAEGLIADAHSLASLGMWFAKRRIGS